MSAPDPLQRQVWASLMDAIAGISAGAHYHHTVKTVTSDLVSLLSLSAQQCPAVMVMASGAGAGRAHHMGGQVKDRLVFQLEFRVDAPGLVVDAKRDAWTKFLLDLEYALTRDVTRGGLASATFVLPADGPYMGFDTAGVMQGQQRVDVVLVRATGER